MRGVLRPYRPAKADYKRLQEVKIFQLNRWLKSLAADHGISGGCGFCFRISTDKR